MYLSEFSSFELLREKFENVLEMCGHPVVSLELSVKHNTQCPKDIPENHWAKRGNRNHFYFHDSSQATGETMSVMLYWQFY